MMQRGRLNAQYPSCAISMKYDGGCRMTMFVIHCRLAHFGVLSIFQFTTRRGKRFSKGRGKRLSKTAGTFGKPYLCFLGSLVHGLVHWDK